MFSYFLPISIQSVLHFNLKKNLILILLNLPTSSSCILLLFAAKFLQSIVYTHYHQLLSSHSLEFASNRPLPVSTELVPVKITSDIPSILSNIKANSHSFYPIWPISVIWHSILQTFSFLGFYIFLDSPYWLFLPCSFCWFLLTSLISKI